MTDAPGVGHNEPPAVDPKAIADFEERVAAFADAAGEWLDLGEIHDDSVAQQLNDFLNGTRGLEREIEKQRKKDKEPFLAGARSVDTTYGALTAPIQLAIKKAKNLLAKFATEKERRQAEEIKRKREEAERAAEKARATLAASETRHDVVAEADAQRTLKMAEKAVSTLEKAKPSGAVRSATGGARTGSLRTSYEAEIEALGPALVWIRDNRREALDDFILATVNAAKRSDRSLEIPGITFKERKTFA